MSDDIHEVYAVCYATHARKRSENYIFGDPHDEMTSIVYYVWVIKGAHGTFAIEAVAAPQPGVSAIAAAPDALAKGAYTDSGLFRHCLSPSATMMGLC